jgi:hypothetical protein
MSFQIIIIRFFQEFYFNMKSLILKPTILKGNHKKITRKL